MYKQGQNCIIRIADGARIPLDPANADYHDYLQWLNDGNVPLSADAPSLADLKAVKLADVNRLAQQYADSMTADYPEFEKLTWEDQRRDTAAWLADPDAPTPYIDVLATERGIDRELYLQKTAAKIAAFTAAAQRLVGQRQKLEDQIKAAASAADLDQIVVAFDLA